MDSAGAAFTRIWCAYELYISTVMKQGTYLHDVYTVVRDVQRDAFASVGLVDGFALADHGLIARKSSREASFPNSLIDLSRNFTLADAESSFAEDKLAILRNIGDEEPTLNATVRSRFGVMVISRLLLAPAGSPEEDTLVHTLSELRNAALHKLTLILSDEADVSLGRAEMLISSLPSSVEELRVNNGGTAFAESAARFAIRGGLRVLQLTCMLGDAGVVRICDALRTSSALSLAQLVLHKTGFADDGAEALARFLSVNISLRYLDVGINKIGDKGAHVLALSLHKNSTLSSMHLHCNLRISDAGRARFIEGLRFNSGLTHLYLHEHRGANDALAAAIVRMLQVNSTLEMLYLADSLFSHAHLGVLVPALKASTTFRHLVLDDNALTDEATPFLVEIVASCSALHTLRASNCGLTDVCIQALVKALASAAKPMALVTMHLRNNAFTEAGRAQITSAWLQSHAGNYGDGGLFL